MHLGGEHMRYAIYTMLVAIHTCIETITLIQVIGMLAYLKPIMHFM